MAHSEKQAKIKTEATESPAAETSHARVLVVDDDSRNLLTITEVLKDIGEIDCAKSGEEALRYLLKQEYAVILLDVLMPGLDGYQTANLIRQRPSSEATPIIFLTAINKEDAHMLRGYDAGAVDFLFKPFDPLMLRSKVGIFVDLFNKTSEIKLKAESERRLLQENLTANAQKLEAVKALQRAEERQEVILRSLPLCVHSRHIESPFGAFFVSGAVERLTGFTADDFTGDPGFGLSRVHPDDAAFVEQMLTNALGSGAYAVEYRWKCADGTYRYFLDQGVVAYEEDGTATEILGTLLDITERRQLEGQLVHAQKLDAIGKLTGGVAHDFNNLLASILSGLALMKRRVDMNPEIQRIFDMTHHAATQGVDLIARMLAFSRRQNLSPTKLHLNHLAETLDLLLTPTLGRLVQLRWEIEPDVEPAYVDPGQLELALMNLVINARDAMPEGGSIAIRARNSRLDAPATDLAAGDYVVLSVEDTGEGIAPEHIDKVLEPFFTTKEVGRGTGLGLSTVYGFARQSGGRLRIESVLGRGTSVEIWLPQAEGESPPHEVASTQPAFAPTPLKGRQPTLLLIDDSDHLRDFTEQQLKDHGFDVVGAHGGAEALALLEKDPDRFDVIITDFAMPLVSGLEVIRLARNLRGGWPAIMITGYADTEAMSRRPQDVPVINKPFQIEKLVRTICEVCCRTPKEED
ncbi:MAG: response regulator [Rhizobiaceae bacterium]|nr:response regulator [Rhizobiaceae bacterium]